LILKGLHQTSKQMELATGEHCIPIHYLQNSVMLNGNPNNILTNQLTTWNKILPQMLMGPQSTIPPQFIEPEGSLLHSQVTTTCPYSQPEQTSPCHSIPVLEDPF
jgi:hypothetical protein